jgi:acyl carrier protein
VLQAFLFKGTRFPDRRLKGGNPLEPVIERPANLRSALAAGLIAAIFMIVPADARSFLTASLAVTPSTIAKFHGLDARANAITIAASTKASDHVSERVRKIIARVLGVNADKVIDTANFVTDLGADELGKVELIMSFEEEFNVQIPDDAAATLLTVGDAVKFLERATAK